MADKKKQVAKKKTSNNKKATASKANKVLKKTSFSNNKNSVNKTAQSNLKTKNVKTKKQEKAIEKSRKANKKDINSKKEKRESTRIIPVEQILKAQKKAEKESLKQARIKDKEKEEFKKEQELATIEKKQKAQKKETNKQLKQKEYKKQAEKREKIKNSKSKKKSNQKKKDTISSILMSSKMKKVYIGIVVLCILILIIEGVYFVILRDRINSRILHYDALNSLVLDKSDIVAVGSSNFRKSKHNDYTDGLEKAKLIKYDASGEIIFEKMYEDGINSTYNHVINTKDGYVAVGSYEKDEAQTRDGVRDALIVKYDKKGNIVWNKTFTSLSNSKFNKVIEVVDGYVVIGQSIYASMEMGNSTEGGGVIIKYSTDGEIMWKKFHGGTKSASFNGITMADGYFYIVGRDGTDFGNLIKYSIDGEYQWHRNYRYTDTQGLSDIVYLNGKLYAVGSKEIFEHEVTDEDKRNTTNTDALLICYNLEGEIEFEKVFGGSSYERYNSLLVYKKDLIAIGSSTSTDSGLRIFTDGKSTTGILVKYDTNGNIEHKNVFGGSNQDNLTDIATDNSNIYVTSYTNSKDGNIIIGKENGRDYYGRLIKLNSRLRILFLK